MRAEHILIAGGLATSLVAGVTSAWSAAAPTAGSAGAGDPYFPDYGNGGYQVVHYDINVTYAPSTHLLTGVTTIKARTTQRLSTFHLDLMLHARGVSVDGVPADFHQRRGHELVVDSGRVIDSGRLMTVQVVYGGRPERVRVPSHIPGVPPVRPWLQTGREAFVNGQPENAALWFPANDHPVDKASYDVTAHVPAGWQAVSNGGLVRRTTGPRGATFHWRQPEPMVSYLAFLGLGHYVIRQGRTRGLPFTYAWSTHLGGHTAQVRRAIRQTPRRVAFLSHFLGRYPYRRYGAVVPRGNVSTIESPGGPVYNSATLTTRKNRLNTMVHELAHQWFGDSVSIRRWKDLWLNEGFAVWMSWFGAAHTGGPPVAAQFRQNYDLHPADDPFWSRRTADPGPGHLFDPAVYTRGAMALQALRTLIGPAPFHRLLRAWVRERADGHGTTKAFVALAEHISGRDLAHYNRVWLHKGSRPRDTAANGFPG